MNVTFCAVVFISTLMRSLLWTLLNYILIFTVPDTHLYSVPSFNVIAVVLAVVCIISPPFMLMSMKSQVWKQNLKNENDCMAFYLVTLVLKYSYSKDAVLIGTDHFAQLEMLMMPLKFAVVHSLLPIEVLKAWRVCVCVGIMTWLVSLTLSFCGKRTTCQWVATGMWVSTRLSGGCQQFCALLSLFFGWRFSAAVASFVARTKLLNIEPG